MKVDRLWTNGRLATLREGAGAYGALEPAALAARDGRIAWIGPLAGAPNFEAAETTDLGGRWVTPGLIDCHTHLVYAGDRAGEFEQRLMGASYREIAEAGGGIVSTVRATREASEDELVGQSRRRLDALLAEGVTTVEIKSGYGLDAENEAKMLRAARRLGAEAPVRVVTTFLGAHALPPEAGDDKEGYIDEVCLSQLPAVHGEGLADAVDGFCETIAFAPHQIRRVFEAAQALGLPVKLHAEQLSNQGGAALAAEFGAVSADHLEYLDEAGVAAMAAAGTAAVLLPGAFYFLRDTQVPPIELLRRHGVPMAVGWRAIATLAPRRSLRCCSP
jgi:imidazolonepropionase